MAEAKKHLWSLDILRFLAAMMVCLNHFAGYSQRAAEITSDTDLRAFPQLAAFENIGAVGVQIFFVISGFVIAFSASTRKGRPDAIDFAKARFWRLVPALWLSSTIGFVALWMNGEAIPDLSVRLAKSLFLIPLAPHIDGVIWTLMVEAVFYALIGLSIFRFEKAPLMPIAFRLSIISGIYLTALLTSEFFRWTALITFLHWFPFTLFLFRHGVYFALGISIWAVAMRNEKISPPRLLVLLCFSAIEIWMAMGQVWSDFILASALFALALLFLRWSIRFCAEVSSKRLARLLGDLSYPIYLNHFTLGMCFSYWFAGFATGDMYLVISLAGVFGVSAMVLAVENAIRWRCHPRGIFRTTVRPPLT